MKKMYSPLLIVLFIMVCFVYIKDIKEEHHMQSQQAFVQIEQLNEMLASQQKKNEVLKGTIENKNKEIKKYLDEIERIRTIRARVTAYSPYDDVNGINSEGDPSVTATGTVSREGIIAVDPKEIPYFTVVHIPGYGIASAEDTGSALRNYDEGIAIDVLVNTYEEALAWGVQYLDVKIQ